MKYIDGMNLLDFRDAYVDKRGGFPLSVVVKILRPIAAALDYAHHPGKVHSGVKSVIHRDIKPENILITKDGREIQIVDFGLAAQVRLSMTRVSNVEMDSVGTRSYMAPEQWRGQFQDDKTDQYALAVVAYELLADRLPFEVADPFQLRECVLNEPVPELPDQSENVNRALARALAKQREGRFPNCQAFIEALQQPATVASPLKVEPAVVVKKTPALMFAPFDATAANATPLKVEPVAVKNTPPLMIAPFDASAAKAGQQAWANFIGQPVEWKNALGMSFRLIPPGEFHMGALDNESDASDQEKPQHRVVITRPFYLGVVPVTQGEYKRITGSNPSLFKSGSNSRDSFPVENVPFETIQAFLKRLMVLDTVHKYRLPTEAEWEYACRAGTEIPFWFGIELNGIQANCCGKKPYGNCGKGPYIETTRPVGSYQPNPFGIFDQHGQVWEWCQDFYSADYYRQFVKQAAIDPLGPASGTFHVLRGGSWRNSAGTCRSAYRYSNFLFDNSCCGLRLACNTT